MHLEHKLPRKQVYLVKFLAVFMWLKTTFHIDFVNVGLLLIHPLIHKNTVCQHLGT